MSHFLVKFFQSLSFFHARNDASLSDLSKQPKLRRLDASPAAVPAGERGGVLSPGDVQSTSGSGHWEQKERLPPNRVGSAGVTFRRERSPDSPPEANFRPGRWQQSTHAAVRAAQHDVVHNQGEELRRHGVAADSRGGDFSGGVSVSSDVRREVGKGAVGLQRLRLHEGPYSAPARKL